MSFIKIPKSLKWKGLTSGQKVISIFGFLSILFWLIASTHDTYSSDSEEFFDEWNIRLLFIFGYIGIVAFAINMGLILS